MPKGAKTSAVVAVLRREVLADVLLQIHQLHEVDVGHGRWTEDLGGEPGVDERLRKLGGVVALVVAGASRR